MEYYDDNFGHWDMSVDREEMEAFYHQVQRTNVSKVCKGCGQQVMIQPQYIYCNSCADEMERGWGC